MSDSISLRRFEYQKRLIKLSAEILICVLSTTQYAMSQSSSAMPAVHEEHCDRKFVTALQKKDATYQVGLKSIQPRDAYALHALLSHEFDRCARADSESHDYGKQTLIAQDLTFSAHYGLMAAVDAISIPNRKAKCQSIHDAIVNYDFVSKLPKTASNQIMIGNAEAGAEHARRMSSGC